jgi:DNA-binding HxlR family transcriptional regulator
MAEPGTLSQRRAESAAPLAQTLPRGRVRRRPNRVTSADSLLHHRLRLGIVSALAATEALTFNELKTLMQTTDGNLSVHARKLEEVHYVTCTKTYEGRRPRTEYRLAPVGRRELQRYLDHMESLIRATRHTLAR